MLVNMLMKKTLFMITMYLLGRMAVAQSCHQLTDIGQTVSFESRLY